jgi:serine/threonine protein kinase
MKRRCVANSRHCGLPTHAAHPPYLVQDVFSFGIVLWQLIYRKAPGVEGFLSRSPRTKFQLDFDELRAHAPKDAPESFVNLAIACCVYDPSERHSSEEALEWLQSLTEELEASDMSLIPPSPSEFRKLKHGTSTSLSDPSSVLLGAVAPGSPAADPTMVVPTPVSAQ